MAGVLVGDPRQFFAVGRGGMFAHLIDTCGAIELDQVHRFANRWEREASLRLRSGDPGVLVEYDQHGRLHDGTRHDMETEILEAWNEARRRGEAVALMADTVDTVTRLNQAAQQTRIRNGELDPNAPGLDVDGQRLLVGDQVVTRRNDRTLRSDRGVMVKNRDHWTIETIHTDKTLMLIGRTGTVRAPADYVTEHVELGYAQTSHATQGRTVDTALLLVDTPDDPRTARQPCLCGHRREPHRCRRPHPSHRSGLDRPTRHRQTLELEARQLDPPRWPSIPEHHATAAESGRVAEPDREPSHPNGAGDDEHDTEEKRIQRLIDERLAAIQQRRRITGRDQLTIGR